MNKKYERYIDYIVNDLEIPYFKNMRDHYGLKQEEYGLVLSRVYNQPVTIKGNYVYDQYGNNIYWEDSYGTWVKYEYNEQGYEIYSENSDGYWVKREFDSNGNEIYYENSRGFWEKREYDTKGNQIYYENGDGVIDDNR